MDISFLRTNSQNYHFVKLIKQLDNELNEIYGELQKKYEKHNKIDFINDVVILYKDKVPVACGAFKEYDNSSVELKRIYVVKDHRKQGLAKLLVNELEKLALSRNYKYAVLETGVRQEVAISLYKNYGYELIPNYGPYIGNNNSVCMKKILFN